MKKCELCNSVARMYCDSDKAVLCWECDGKVHSANFIVTKHTRTLLCQVCQCLTPWIGSGAKLGPTVSVCDRCLGSGENPRKVTTNHEDDNENGEEDDDDKDNQVVPLCSTTTSEETMGRGNKRKHRDQNL